MTTSNVRSARLGALGVLLLAAACTAAPPPPKAPAPPPPPPAPTAAPAPTAPAREEPPASGPARPLAFPKVAWSTLPTGLKVATIEGHALPLVQIRVVVQAGRSADGDHPGLAEVTGQLLKDGGAGAFGARELMTRIESLGGTLSIDTGFDSTVLSLAVTKDHLGEALDLLGTIVREPQLSQPELVKVKKRETDRVSDAARSSGRWSASMVLWRDLFVLPTDHHPYASYDATPADIAKITAQDCRTFHHKYFVPTNAFVVVAGDTDEAAVKAAAEKAFGGFRGGEAPVVSFTDPMPPSGLKITLVDRPKSSQSDVYVGMLGPHRDDKAWPAMAVANQVLGGGVAGRLFMDVREKRSLAYNARSSLVELAHGPSVLLAYVGTQTAKTGLATAAVLEHVARLGSSAPSQDETDTATRYLSDVFAIKLETIGAVADELVKLKLLGLPDDYDDGYRKELREVTPAAAGAIAGEHAREGHAIVVVAGDADKIGPMLSHFGEVKVVDPTKGFERERTIPMNAGAPLEAPREAGQ
jgi:predicted Zn-dependent peptidase